MLLTRSDLRYLHFDSEKSHFLKNQIYPFKYFSIVICLDLPVHDLLFSLFSIS